MKKQKNASHKVSGKRFKVNLLPGPVHIIDRVIEDFGRVPISHRASHFIDDLREVKSMFRAVTRSKNVEICLGSGTMANDLVAGQLHLINKRGIILSNGEFGSRLIDHAKRLGLNFEAIKLPWGKSFNYKNLEKKLSESDFHWIWFVHHETSTGMLNDFESIKRMAKKNKMIVCVDCISSICAVPLDLSDIDFASGTSGKAIAAYPGLSFVFFKKLYSSKDRNVQRYLDLRHYRKCKGVPFTSSSNLLSALKNALTYFLKDTYRFEKISKQTTWIKKRLSDMNISVLVNGKYASPIITTVLLPKKINSMKLGNKLKSLGYHIHYESSYLKKKNWIQISSMSLYSKEYLEPVFNILKKAMHSR